MPKKDHTLRIPRYDVHDSLLEERVAEDAEMLGKLGMTMVAFQPDVRIETPDGGRVACDQVAWNWIRPLLRVIAQHAPDTIQ
jgi:hypothetical protein